MKKLWLVALILLVYTSAKSQLVVKNSSNSEVIRLTQSGNVGIGTTSPINKLDVAGSVAIGTYAGANSGPSNGLIISGNVGVGKTNPDARLYVSGSNLTQLNYKINDGPLMSAYTSIYSREVSRGNTESQIVVEVIGSTVTADDNATFHIGVHGVLLNSSNQQLVAGSIGYVNMGHDVYAGVQGHVFNPSGGGVITNYLTAAGRFENERTGTNDWGVLIDGALRLWGGGNIQNVPDVNGIIYFGVTDLNYNINRNTATQTLYIAANDGSIDLRSNFVKFNGTTMWSSDLQLKKDIHTIAAGLETVQQLRPVSYRWKNRPDGPEQLGLVAQEVEAILPQLVSQDADGMKSINYVGLIPVLIKAIQEQQALIHAQEDRIKKLENNR